MTEQQKDVSDVTVIEEPNEEVEEPIEDNKEEVEDIEDASITKPKKKERKPFVMTEARKKAFAKAQEQRKKNIALKKKEKEQSSTKKKVILPNKRKYWMKEAEER